MLSVDNLGRAGGPPDGPAPARRRLLRRRVHGRHHLHRQRPELHGQGDRRAAPRPDAQLLRLHRSGRSRSWFRCSGSSPTSSSDPDGPTDPHRPTCSTGAISAPGGADRPAPPSRGDPQPAADSDSAGRRTRPAEQPESRSRGLEEPPARPMPPAGDGGRRSRSDTLAGAATPRPRRVAAGSGDRAHLPDRAAHRQHAPASHQGRRGRALDAQAIPEGAPVRRPGGGGPSRRGRGQRRGGQPQRDRGRTHFRPSAHHHRAPAADLREAGQRGSAGVRGTDSLRPSGSRPFDGRSRSDRAVSRAGDRRRSHRAATVAAERRACRLPGGGAIDSELGSDDHCVRRGPHRARSRLGEHRGVRRTGAGRPARVSLDRSEQRMVLVHRPSQSPARGPPAHPVRDLPIARRPRCGAPSSMSAPAARPRPKPSAESAARFPAHELPPAS